MEMSLDLWIEYLLRFSHLVAGISWIGSSFYFIWLDSSFLPPEEEEKNVDGEVFMVHGGFYYEVKKKKIAAGELPKILHWFKWEATLTFITGFLLFFYLYFLNDATLLINPNVYPLTQLQAITISLAVIVFSWFVYDSIWHYKIFRPKILAGTLTLIFYSLLIYFLTRLFSGRGAYMIMGAIFGVSMLLNVWVRILPGQSKIVNRAKAGEDPDHSFSLKSKLRSVHNTYFIFPVLFIMLSNHYPAVYNHPQSWIMLIILSVSGALARHAMVTKRPIERWTMFPAAIGLVSLVFMTAQLTLVKTIDAKVSYDDIKPIFKARCLQCHSTNNTDETFDEAPNDLVFETEAQIQLHRKAIIEQAVQGKTMPLNNVTEITDEERAMINKYFIDN